MRIVRSAATIGLAAAGAAICVHAQRQELANPALSQVRVRLLNGKTGAPVADKQIFFDRKSRLLTHAEDRPAITDADGMATAMLPAGAVLRNPEVIGFRTCSGKPRHGHDDYPAALIASTGIVSSNGCGKATAAAKPGELVLWVRPRSLLERATD